MLSKSTLFTVMMDWVMQEAKKKAAPMLKGKTKRGKQSPGPLGPPPRTDNYAISPQFQEHPRFANPVEYYAMLDARRRGVSGSGTGGGDSVTPPSGGLSNLGGLDGQAIVRKVAGLI
jgi:hypothetical protein